MNDDEISSDEECDNYCLLMDELQKEFIADWKKALLEVQTKKIGNDRDLFVSLFTRALMRGELPDDALRYLVMGMLMNPEQVAVILDVTFKKGEEKKSTLDTASVQIALKVVIENNGALYDVPDKVFDKVANMVSKEPETVKKYYSRELYESIPETSGRPQCTLYDCIFHLNPFCHFTPWRKGFFYYKLVAY